MTSPASPLRLVSLLCPALAAVAMGSGCTEPDPLGVIDEFTVARDRLDNADVTTDTTPIDTSHVDHGGTDGAPSDGSGDSGPPPIDCVNGPWQREDLTGTWLFGFSSIIARNLPILMRIDAVASGDLGSIDQIYQPLTTDVIPGTTDPRENPREPVGDSLTIDDTAYSGEDGTFVFALDHVVVTGEANPISGSEIEATLELTAHACGPDFFCGTVSGEVFRPLQVPSLAGSTFTAIRVPDGATLTDLPVLLSCGEWPPPAGE